MHKIKLSNGGHVLVDELDYPYLSKFSWFKRRGGSKTKCGTKNPPYAARLVGRKMIAMHREIMNPPRGFVVDHRNGKTLDNRRDNLRICTHKQNICSQKPQRRKKTSMYKGVSWHKSTQRWRATMRKDGRAIHLGAFKTQVAAARCYNEGAKKAWGEFAWLNKV